MNWRDIWAIAVGQEPVTKEIPPVLASVLLYIIAYVICFSLHNLSKLLLPQFLKPYALDFFKTLVICTYPYGHGLIRDTHGHVGYCLAAVPLVVLTLQTFDGGSPSPLDVFQNYIHGKLSMVFMLLRIVVQTLAGFASYQLVRFIWMLEMHQTHSDKLQAVDCLTDLNVPLMVGFMLEMLGCVYDTWLGYQPLSRTPLLDQMLKVFNSALMVCAGVHMTGMYMHPAMASGLTYGCHGTSALEHIFVYWLGAFTGSYGGHILNKFLHFGSTAETDKAAANGRSKKSTQKNGHKHRSKKTS